VRLMEIVGVSGAALLLIGFIWLGVYLFRK
jgi:hypothetical protein